MRNETGASAADAGPARGGSSTGGSSGAGSSPALVDAARASPPTNGEGGSAGEAGRGSVAGGAAGDVNADPLPASTAGTTTLDAGSRATEMDAAPNPQPSDPPASDAAAEAGRARDASARDACVEDSECSAEDYCKKASCSAATGRCAVRTLSCGSAMNPVCGCDGVTYFNPCLAARSGQNVGLASECSEATAVRCGRATDEPCGASAFCGTLLARETSCLAATLGAVAGHCWVLPAVCTDDVNDHYDSCVRGGDRCVHTCQAIKDGIPYFRQTSCN